MEKIEWIRPNINNIKRFEQRSDLKGILYILFYFILLGITGYLTYYFLINHNYILGFCLLFLHGTFFCFLGWSGIGHELVHKSVFKTLWLNNLFLKLFAFLSWNNYVYFTESHIRHHKYTLNKDLDKEIILPLSPEYNQWIYLLTLNIPFFLRNLKFIIQNCFGKISGTWGNELFMQKDKKRKELFNFARIMLIGHIILSVFFIMSEQYYLLLIITFAPFTANWLNRMLAISQHIHMKANSNDFRKNSTSIRLNWFLSTLYSNMNYHLEHHLYPHIPFYNLPSLSKELNNFSPTPIIGFINTIKYILNTKDRNDIR